jgi:hypothetical protein
LKPPQKIAPPRNRRGLAGALLSLCYGRLGGQWRPYAFCNVDPEVWFRSTRVSAVKSNLRAMPSLSHRRAGMFGPWRPSPAKHPPTGPGWNGNSHPFDTLMAAKELPCSAFLTIRPELQGSGRHERSHIRSRSVRSRCLDANTGLFLVRPRCSRFLLQHRGNGKGKSMDDLLPAPLAPSVAAMSPGSFSTPARKRLAAAGVPEPHGKYRCVEGHPVAHL